MKIVVVNKKQSFLPNISHRILTQRAQKCTRKFYVQFPVLSIDRLPPIPPFRFFFRTRVKGRGGKIIRTKEQKIFLLHKLLERGNE